MCQKFPNSFFDSKFFFAFFLSLVIFGEINKDNIFLLKNITVKSNIAFKRDFA